MYYLVWRYVDDKRHVVDILEHPWNKYPNGGAHKCYKAIFPYESFDAGQYTMDEYVKGVGWA